MKSHDVQVKTNCRFYLGDVPCVYHKEKGVLCVHCRFFKPITSRILIIKLGVTGDVLRTTPLLTKLRATYPYAEITWITDWPEVLPSTVDRILPFTSDSILLVTADTYDIVINLDKDLRACALASRVSARKKMGFILKNGRCAPVNKKARHKWLTGIFDDLNKKNTKTYQEEIFEICGVTFNNEEYVTDHPLAKKKKNIFTVGLNTGCGKRWVTKAWPSRYWIALAKLLKKNSFAVILLGGKEEDALNKKIARASKVSYPGHFPLKKFFDIVNQCGVVVTADSLALHVAVALRKKVVALMGPTSNREIYLYNRGTILTGTLSCTGCYRRTCSKKPSCMDTITPLAVFKTITNLLRTPSS